MRPSKLARSTPPACTGMLHLVVTLRRLEKNSMAPVPVTSNEPYLLAVPYMPPNEKGSLCTRTCVCVGVAGETGGNNNNNAKSRAVFALPWHGDANVDTNHASTEALGEPLGMGTNGRVHTRSVAIVAGVLNLEGLLKVGHLCVYVRVRGVSVVCHALSAATCRGCPRGVYLEHTEDWAKDLVLEARLVSAVVHHDGGANLSAHIIKDA